MIFFLPGRIINRFSTDIGTIDEQMLLPIMDCIHVITIIKYLLILKPIIVPFIFIVSHLGCIYGVGSFSFDRICQYLLVSDTYLCRSSIILFYYTFFLNNVSEYQTFRRSL